MSAPFIVEPGRYDLDEAVYHADPVVGGSLSSTGARTLATSTPAHFAWQRKHGRPDAAVLDVGRAAHRAVLGEGGGYIVIAGSGSNPNAWTTNATKVEVAEARAAGLTPITPRDAETIEAMAAAVHAHPVAGPLLARAGRAEQSYVARCPDTGVMCRVRIDWQPDTSGARPLLVDYKTTKDASPDGFATSMGRYGYHQQAAFYSDAITWLGLGEDPQFVFVAQEKEPPYLVTVAVPSLAAMEWGRLLNHRARSLYAACSASGQWPGYPTSPVLLDLPGWLERQYEAAEADGTYDPTGVPA